MGREVVARADEDNTKTRWPTERTSAARVEQNGRRERHLRLALKANTFVLRDCSVLRKLRMFLETADVFGDCGFFWRLQMFLETAEFFGDCGD